MRVGYAAFYADGSENDSDDFHTVETVEEALALAWTDRVVYPHDGLVIKPVGVLVYDENFTTIAVEGIQPQS